MKKFILLAALGIAAATYQPAEAQVSINVNIGTPAYYGYNAYHVPSRPVVYVERDVRYHSNYNYYPKRRIVYRPQPNHRNAYYSNHSSSNRYYGVRRVDYKQHYQSFKHKNDRGHGKGRH